MEQRIENTNFTISLLESELQRALNTACSISKWSSKVLSPERGFLSIITRVELKWSGRESDSLPRSVLIKVPTTSKWDDVMEQLQTKSTTQEEQKAASDQIAQILITVHNAECAFYQLQPPPEKALKVPRFFFAKKFNQENCPGYLVMEDLSDLVADRNITHDLSLDAVFQLINFLVDVHVYSLTNTGWLQDPDLVFNGQRLSDWVREHKQTVLDAMKAIAEQLPSLRKYVDRTHELYTCLEPSGNIWLPQAEDNMPSVLCNGDVWMNNLLWKKDSKGEASDELVAVVDWQCSHPGTVSEDLAILMLTSLPTKMRHNHLQEILNYYYRRLQEKLGKQPPFSMTQLNESFRRSYQRYCFRSIEDYPISIKMFEEDDVGKRTILHRCQTVVEDAFALLDGKEFGAYSTSDAI